MSPSDYHAGLRYLWTSPIFKKSVIFCSRCKRSMQPVFVCFSEHAKCARILP